MNLAAHINEQAKEVDTNPTEPQKHAGNYKKGHVKVHGLDISIENPRGSWREGGPPGKRWKARLPHHYGDIKRTIGGDNDNVDCFIGPHLKSPHVFVIDQHHLDGGKGFDEHKCMIGFGSKVQAREAYHRAFSDGRGKDRIGHIEIMTIDGFKRWLSHGNTRVPVKSHRRRYAEGGSVDDLPDVGDSLIPSGQTWRGTDIGNKAADIGSRMAAGAAQSIATLPRRAIENSQNALDTGTYDPTVPVEAALNTMGGGSLVSHGTDATLGIVPVDVARKLGFKSNLPQTDTFRRAIENTPGATADTEAMTLPVMRQQHPDQEMAESVRGGVFYLPQGAETAKHYTGKNYYGGSQRVEGETAFKNPLFVKGATGGKAPEMAFDQINGKGAYDSMRSDALEAIHGKGWGARPDEAKVYSFLEKHAPEMSDYAGYIIENSTKGNQLPYALQEAAVASAARRAGHDGIIGYSTKRNPTKDPFISEVYDVRENRYPSPSGDYSIWDDPRYRADGGRVHMADGGAPSFDQTQPADSGPPPFEATQPTTPDVGGATAFGRGALQGATFNFADELRAIDEAGGASSTDPGTPLTSIKGAYKYFTGDPEAEQRYNAALERERAANETAKAQHPYLHMAGELAGSIPAMAVLPGGELGEAASLGTKMVQGAKVGAEYGGLSGLGEGTDTGDRAMKAAEGIVGGIVGGAAAPVVGSAANAVSERFIQPTIGAVRGAIDPAAEASRRLTSALQKDQELIAAGKAEGMSPQQWAAARAAGEPVTLADLGSSNTQALLRSSANTSPEGRAILEKALNDRFAGQTERVANEARGLVAGGANAGKTGDQLVAEYDAARAPAYKRAYQDGDKEIVSPTIERLMGSPMFEGAMKSAITTGKDRAITEGMGAFNPGIRLDPGGAFVFTKTKPNGGPVYPNLQYWDSVKKELDGIANVARRSGDMGKADVAGNLAKTLRSELDQQVPSYANARGIASQYFGESNALEAGQKLAGKRVDPKQISDVMRQMKPDERELFREGYASDWANRVISNISDSRDITKAMFNSPNERARALAVFGPAGVDKMQARMSLETIMDGARKAMGNSTTARQLIEAGLAGGALEGYMSGWDPTKMAEGAAGAAGARKFLGSEMAAGARKLVGKVDTKTARLVAELLTSDDPRKLQQGMRMAQKNQRIGDGLKNIANRVALAGQQQVAPPATRLIVHPMQGPMPVGAGQEQQQP